MAMIIDDVVKELEDFEKLLLETGGAYPGAPTTIGKYELTVKVEDGKVTYEWNPVYPDPSSTDGAYQLEAAVSSGTPTYSWGKKYPNPSSSDGNYQLEAAVSDGTVVYSWGEKPVIPVVPVAANQAASTATELAGLVTDFNNLLSKLKEAGLMTADA